MLRPINTEIYPYACNKLFYVLESSKQRRTMVLASQLACYAITAMQQPSQATQPHLQAI